ncbi:hypothetical protein CLOP_g14740 [Closterium sp. NIES-67]|nr:hypothetical protein CLOP_g14740 [Closterium sp. NIES-67]
MAGRCRGTDLDGPSSCRVAIDELLVNIAPSPHKSRRIVSDRPPWCGSHTSSTSNSSVPHSTTLSSSLLLQACISGCREVVASSRLCQCVSVCSAPLKPHRNRTAKPAHLR